MDWENKIKELEGWHFGGKGSGLEDSLARLVLEGKKTATCSWHRAYEVENEPLPQVGQQSYIMNSDDKPVCVIELTSVEVMPFLEVDAEFSYLEGEGDRSYEYWRNEHERFFGDYAKVLGIEWNAQTESVVCEIFRVIHKFGDHGL